MTSSMNPRARSGASERSDRARPVTRWGSGRVMFAPLVGASGSGPTGCVVHSRSAASTGASTDRPFLPPPLGHPGADGCLTGRPASGGLRPGSAVGIRGPGPISGVQFPHELGDTVVALVQGQVPGDLDHPYVGVEAPPRRQL